MIRHRVTVEEISNHILNRDEAMQLGCGDGFVCTNESYGECSLGAKEDASGNSFNSEEDCHDISDFDARMTTQHGSQDSRVKTEAEKGSLSIDVEIIAETVFALLLLYIK